MNIAYVTANKLNVRKQPNVTGSNKMGILSMGDKVENVVDAYNPGWALVTCRADWINPGNTQRRGYVSKKYLRRERVGTVTGKRYVTATTLNVRSEPRSVDSTLVGKLRMAAPVDFIEKSTVADWVRVECEADWIKSGPKRRQGYVSNKYLRNPEREPVERLIGSAFNQWKRFSYGFGEENRSPYYDYVGEMWDSLNINLDGRDTSVPWSAAAISFMVRNSGANYSGFKYSSGHWEFLNDAISDRQNRRAGPFWGYRITERKPEVGDIVGRWRKQRITYGSAYAKSKNSRRDQQAYKSHSDIIVAVTGNAAYAIGGNVGNSVSRTTYTIGRDGHLTADKNVFVILKNKAA